MLLLLLLLWVTGWVVAVILIAKIIVNQINKR